jgi:periplasmic divalent cation tolerance protein
MINVITTVDSRETLEKIGRLLLEKRLVACLQIIGPVRSIYWWKGRLEEAEEWIGIMKTRRELYFDVEKEIRALHPYEVPQIEAIDAVSVLPVYERWLIDETSADEPDKV